MTNASDNPFLSFSTNPRFAELTPDSVDAAVDSVLAAASKTEQDLLASPAPPSWDNTVAPLEAADENISRVWNQIEHMHAVMSSADWRASHQNNLPKVASFFAARGQNADLYERWKALADSPAFADLPAARQKILRDGLLSFQHAGVALPADKREEFRHKCERLATLGAQFEENLLAATNDFFMDIPQEKTLGDMPPDLRATAKQTAQDAGVDGFRFTLQPPSYLAFMQYGTDSKKREILYRAYQTRASELGPAEQNNTPLLEEILRLRQEQAALLGFDSYATLALQTRMSPSVVAVRDFLQDLVRRARPHAEKEIAELRRFAAKELNIIELSAWDVPFAAEKMRQKLFDLSAAELRPYLREDKILDGLFGCVQQLFGIVAKPATAPVWREDIRYLELFDADGQHLGGLYLDLYASNTKRGGAWMAEVVSRCRREGALQKPLAHIVCNFAKPMDGKPALLNWDEVVTLFHECGHALHHLLTEMQDYSVSGINGVEWDAVELPSQWLENFVWDWRVLQPMTSHVDSGEPLPAELFAKMQAGRLFQSGMRLMRQLEFALFDLTLHTDNPNAADALSDVRRQTALLPLPPYNRFYCGFSHIFAGGYAAGYYSYLWAEVLAADIFAMFTSSGDVLNSQLGAQFRQHVLAVGGGRPAMESFIAMRGQPPRIEPLLAHYGMTG